VAPSVLVVTGGHPYEAEPFFAVFDAIVPGRWRHATTPDLDADVVVFYDMPGIRFTRADPPAQFPEPSDDVRAVIAELQQRGTGLVFLHHAVAGWPVWPQYAELIGGRFHYQPATLRGVSYPDSGYAFDVTHHVEVLASEHPICAGLGDGFDITDELYLFPVLEDTVVPLMRTTAPMDDPSQFFSADLAIRGERNSNRGWTHPTGSSLVAWVKAAGNAPLAYIQFGDGPVTYADPNYRRVIANAIDWAASAEARNWATTS
jgi:uncharacterized protein